MEMKMRTTSVVLLVAWLVLIQGRNEKGLTLDQVLDKLMADLNKTRDDVVNYADISKDLKTKWDSNGDGCLSRKEFEKQWVDSYHYDVDTISLFFSRLDIDQDGCLNSTDADMHRYAIDTNRDGVITVQEFRTFVKHVTMGRSTDYLIFCLRMSCFLNRGFMQLNCGL